MKCVILPRGFESQIVDPLDPLHITIAFQGVTGELHLGWRQEFGLGRTRFRN